MDKNDKRIAVLGASGFLGATIYGALKGHYVNSEVIDITRENYNDVCGERFDVFINANGNSKRYWANANAYADFEASTCSVYKTFSDFDIKKYVYISSADVYGDVCDPVMTKEGTNIISERLCSYGFNKFIAETIIKKYSESYLIFRCSAMIGEGIKKGPILDAVSGDPLYLTIDSKLQFISVSEISNIIVEMIDSNVSNETFNVGGKGSLLFSDLETILQKKIIIRKDAEKQFYEMNVDKLENFFDIRGSEEYVCEFLNINRVEEE